MEYELWQSREGNVEVHTLLPSGTRLSPPLLEPDARVIWKFEAENWEDARRKQHEFLGWEPYKPMTDEAPLGAKRIR